MHAVGFSTGWVRGCVRIRALNTNVQSSDNFQVIMPHDQSISQKCAACSDEVAPVMKPGVSVKSVRKWITESDREMNMSA